MRLKMTEKRKTSVLEAKWRQHFKENGVRHCIKSFRMIGEGKSENDLATPTWGLSVLRRHRGYKSLNAAGSTEGLGTATQVTIWDILLRRAQGNEMVSRRGFKIEKKKNCWFYSLFVKDHRNYNPCWWERVGRDWKVSDRGERGKALEQSLHRCRRRLARVPRWGDCLEVRALTLPRLHVEGRQKYGHRCGCDGGMDTACGSSPDCMYFLSEIGSKIWDNHLEEWIV